MMFNKGSPSTTMAAPAVANQVAANRSPFSDPWKNMRDVGVPIARDKPNQIFPELMNREQPKSQFSPVQFGNTDNPQALARYIASLLGKG